MKHIILVIDRSGSMRPIADEMNGGLETWLEETKKLDPTALVTSVTFDSTYEVTNERKPITEVTPESLFIKPRGMTALNDATYVALKFSKKKDDGGLVLIVTDGQENASREVSLTDVKDRIAKLSKRGVTFQYLSASLSAFEDSKKLGLTQSQTMMYSATPGMAGRQVTNSNITASSVYLREPTEKIKKAVVEDVTAAMKDKTPTKSVSPLATKKSPFIGRRTPTTEAKTP